MSESKLVDLEDSEEKVERVEEDSNVSFSSSPTPLSISQEEHLTLGRADEFAKGFAWYSTNG